MEIELKAFCEVDKFAVESYKAIHDVGDEKNLGDITKIDMEALPEEIQGADLLTHGSPCFPAGVLVKTVEGYKKIEEIEVGDSVLTHKNRYRAVYELHKTRSSDIYKVEIRGHESIEATGNHPFYVRRGIQRRPEWLRLDKIREGMYVGVTGVEGSEELREERQKGIGIDGIVWLKVEGVEKQDSEEIDVYNMEVEEDHTYTVSNIIVHNCQDFSQAGANKGGDTGSGTRSSLMWNSVEIIKKSKPKIVIWENVKNVLSARHKGNFDMYIEALEELGYNSYYEVLNAREYGDIQNRERVFVVSIRKEVDTGEFIFPEPFPLEGHIKEIVESEVDERFYLTEKQLDRIINSTYNQNRRRIQEKEYSDTLCARDYKDPKCIETEEGVRKLTPREYWRIMGFSDADFDKAQGAGISNSQLYKQAGNSIALGVLTEIMKSLQKAQPEEVVEGMGVVSLFSGVGAFEMSLEGMDGLKGEK